MIIGLSAVPLAVTAQRALCEYVPPYRISSSPGWSELAMVSNSSYASVIAGWILYVNPEPIPLQSGSSTKHTTIFFVLFT